MGENLKAVREGLAKICMDWIVPVRTVCKVPVSVLSTEN